MLSLPLSHVGLQGNNEKLFLNAGDQMAGSKEHSTTDK